MRPPDDVAEANAWHSLWMVGATTPTAGPPFAGGRADPHRPVETSLDGARAYWDATLGDTGAWSLNAKVRR